MLWSWLILSFAIWLTALILPGFHVRGFFSVLIVAALFGALHWLLGWLLFIVIGFGTLGIGFLLAFLTRLVVTTLVLKLTDALTSRLTIRSFGTAFVAALLMSGFGTLGEYLLAVLR